MAVKALYDYDFPARDRAELFGAGHRDVVFVVGGVDIVAVSDGGHLSNLIPEIWDSGLEVRHRSSAFQMP